MCSFTLGVFVLCFLLVPHWNDAGHHEYMKPATISASLAVISTANKYLHNNLARAIKALEQKKMCAPSLRTGEARIYISSFSGGWSFQLCLEQGEVDSRGPGER